MNILIFNLFYWILFIFGKTVNDLIFKSKNIANIPISIFYPIYSLLFIGNLSFGYALAEALKVPRLLESGPNFPLVYPNGENAYDFYFQSHFEELTKKLYFK